MFEIAIEPQHTEVIVAPAPLAPGRSPEPGD